MPLVWCSTVDGAFCIFIAVSLSRLASKNGVSHTYNSSHFHAVSSLSNGNTYSYDANGNMTYRHVYESGTWKNYTFVYDAENRLATVTGPVTVNFKYDGDSKRVRATINGGLDTVFIGNYFEWNVATQAKRTYYFAGSSRVAMREGSGDPQWILGDHLGSTSKMVSYLGADTGGQCYKAWGETRLQTGAIPTKYQYTGQYNQVIIGLYYYGARWYDAALGRFIQSDTIIPEQYNSQAWDRYAYTLNNPLKYVDPSGNCTGESSDRNNWDIACWDRWRLIQKEFPNIHVSSKFKSSELYTIYKSVTLTAQAFGGVDNFIKAMGYFNIMRNLLPKTGSFTWQDGIGKIVTIFLGSDAFSSDYVDNLSRIIHEMAHVFDFQGDSNRVSPRWSNLFIDVLNTNSSCNPGMMGCLGQGVRFLYRLLNLNSGGDPLNSYIPSGSPSPYAGTSSIEDFAVSFSAFILTGNGFSLSVVLDPKRELIISTIISMYQ